MKHGKVNKHNDKSKVVPTRKGEQNVEGDKKPIKEVVPEYRKRILKTNHDRYDQPITDDSDSEDELGDLDETKSIEYIKRNYSGVSSHFQFKEEKEWQDEHGPPANSNLFSLDLNSLSSELSVIDTFHKLQLSEMDSSHSYCVNNLSGLIHEKDKSNSSPFEKQSTFQWSYQGVEQYNIGAPTTSNTENHSPVTPNNLTGTAEVTKQRNSPDSSSSPEEDVPEETFNTDTNYRETIDTDECDENGGLTISVKTVEIKGTEEIKINVEENSDLPAASLDMISKDENEKAPSTPEDEGTQELDDWLDSII